MNVPLQIVATPRDKPIPEECEVDYGRACATIPEGEYKAVFTHHETAFVFKTAKVFVWFKLIDPGPHFGKLIYKAFRARNLKAKPAKNGGFVLNARSDLCLMLCRVLDLKMRPDRISTSSLKGKVLRVSVRTVTHDYKQRAIPEPLRYSVLSEILAAETG